MKAVRALHPGQCRICRRPFKRHERIKRMPTGPWGHGECVNALVERERILAGETFAGQAPSTWRRR